MIRIDFKDPGMHPKTVNALDEAEVIAALSKAADERHYTRAYVYRPGDARKGCELWVRAQGSSAWQKWDDMNYRERYDWNEQDKAK